MGKVVYAASFPLFSKPPVGINTRHLGKTTKHLEKNRKHLVKITRHLVFSGYYLAVRQVAGGVTKMAIKLFLNFIYIKVLGLCRADSRSA